jgi:hypothetical protein
MPQSNSIVERSNTILKRIFNKLTFIHADQDKSKWSKYLEQAIQIYNNKIYTTIEVTPAQSIEYEHEDDYSNVMKGVKDKAIELSPFQNSYAEGQVVRLRKTILNIDKFDKPNWSEQKYASTTILQKAKIN